jgi:DHA2 family methylenomycin A resistance protein-like MFS transporter
MAACALGLAVLSIGATSAPYAATAIGLAIFAIGQSLVAPAQTLAIMTVTPEEHKNMGSSALNTARQSGGVIGVALLGAIATGHPTSGAPTAMSAAVIASLAATVAAIKLLPPTLPRQPAHPPPSARPTSTSSPASRSPR